MSGVDIADIAENALLLLRAGASARAFTEDGADKGFQFCCIH